MQFGRRTEASAQARLLRPDYPQTGLWEAISTVAEVCRDDPDRGLFAVDVTLFSSTTTPDQTDAIR